MTESCVCNCGNGASIGLCSDCAHKLLHGEKRISHETYKKICDALLNINGMFNNIIARSKFKEGSMEMEALSSLENAMKALSKEDKEFKIPLF